MQAIKYMLKNLANYKKTKVNIYYKKATVNSCLFFYERIYKNKMKRKECIFYYIARSAQNLTHSKTISNLINC